MPSDDSQSAARHTASSPGESCAWNVGAGSTPSLALSQSLLVGGSLPSCRTRYMSPSSLSRLPLSAMYHHELPDFIVYRSSHHFSFVKSGAPP